MYKASARGAALGLIAILATALLLPTQPAYGWANGSDGPNAYGTHDWILDKAVRALRARNQPVGWIALDTALAATDDPDTVDGLTKASSPWWHVYDRTGSTYGAAPDAARYWFNRAARRLANGNRRGASKAVGILAHIVGDVANPLHTDQTPLEELLHSAYEDDVDERSERSDSVYRFRYDGRDFARPAPRTISVARAAHPAYLNLVNGYDLNGYSGQVHDITKRQLNRAANAVADLIVRIRAVSKTITPSGGGGGSAGGGGSGGGGGGGCHPSYPDFCIPPPPPDLDCADVNGTNFTVVGSDPHGFDGEGDGIGCES